MSQTYKFKTLTIAKKAEENNDSNTSDHTEQDTSPTAYSLGQSKTIDLKLSNNTRHGFHYSHLLTLILAANNDNQHTITLTFSTHTVTLTGYHLTPLYTHLLSHSITSITEQDERYKSMEKEGETFVTRVEIEGS